SARVIGNYRRNGYFAELLPNPRGEPPVPLLRPAGGATIDVARGGPQGPARLRTATHPQSGATPGVCPKKRREVSAAEVILWVVQKSGAVRNFAGSLRHPATPITVAAGALACLLPLGRRRDARTSGAVSSTRLHLDGRPTRNRIRSL